MTTVLMTVKHTQDEAEPSMMLSVHYIAANNCRSGTLTFVTCLQAWHVNAQRLNTLQQLHSFMHQEHACYSVAHQVRIRRLLVHRV